jgi:hypothetical protein
MNPYPEKKTRDLSDAEKAQIRKRLQGSDGDIYLIAQEFNCASSQVAGIKASMTKGQ